MNKVCAIILTWDEEPRIEGCLKRLKPYVDYIIVLDCSDDHTAEIAEKYADVVEKRPVAKDYAQERNYALTLVPEWCNWVLFPDADEIFDVQFLRIMREQKKYTDCVRLPRCNLPDGKDYPDYQIKFHRNDPDFEWRSQIEKEGHRFFEVLYSKKENKRVDQCGVVVLFDQSPIIHLQRRKDIKRVWW